MHHIEDLRNYQWERYCNSQESEMKRLQTELGKVQTEFDRLEQTCRNRHGRCNDYDKIIRP